MVGHIKDAIMPKTLTGINPDVLRWARERSGLTLADVAKKFGKSSDRR